MATISDRELINDTQTIDGQPLHDQLQELQLWGNIHRAAKTDPSLQAALDRVKVTYYLTEHYENRHGNRKT